MQFDIRFFKRLFAVVAGGIALYWALHNYSLIGSILGFGWSLIFPFFLGLVIAFLLNIPMGAIEKKLFHNRLPRSKRSLSFLITLILVLGVFALVGFLVIPQLINTAALLGKSMPDYVQRIQKNLATLEKSFPLIANQIKNIKLDWENISQTLLGWLQNGAGSIFNSAANVASSFISGTTSFVIGFIFAAYVLFDKEHIAAQTNTLLKAYLPPKFYQKLFRVIGVAHNTFTRFVTGQCLESVAVAILFTVSLFIGRFNYAVLIGVLIGVASLIPVFGSFIGCIIGAFLIFVSQGFWRGVAFLILFIVLQQLDGNFMYPRIVGNSVGLPPIWVLVAVILGAGLMGIVGMLLFIPFASVIYQLLSLAARARLEKNQMSVPVDDYHKQNQLKKQEKQSKKK